MVTQHVRLHHRSAGGFLSWRSWAAAAGPSCHRWRILRWSGRRPYRWCYWSGPESLLVFGWHRWLCCTSSCLSDDWKDKKNKKTPPLRRKRIFIKCGFNTELDLHPFKVLSPRCFLVPKRPMNGLSMIPWPNQASLSARSLSRSLDELGLKYLNHREETKPSNTDSLFKTSTSFRSKKQITQLLTICKKKRMHFSTHDQNWLPPPEKSMSCSTALEFLTATFISSGSRSEVHKNITARQRLSRTENDVRVIRHWPTCDPGPWWHNAAARAGRAGEQATSGDAWSPGIKQK